VKSLAKRGLMYGFFGSMGHDLFKKTKNNPGAAIFIFCAVASFIATVKAPQAITNGSSTITKVLVVLLAPIYIGMAFLTLALGQMFFLVLRQGLTEIGYEDTWLLTNFITNIFLALSANISSITSIAGYSEIISAYIITIPFLFFSALLGLSSKINQDVNQ